MTKSSRKGDIEKVVQQTAPVRRGTEISCDTVSAGYSAEKRTGQLFWAERHGSPVCGAEISDNNFDARNEDRSLQVSAPRNRNPRGNPKGNAQKTIKDPKLRILCSTDLERTVFARRFVQLHFSKKKRKGKSRRSRSIPMEPEGTRKVTEGDTRGRGPKGTSPSGKSNVLVCYQLQKWQSPEESACDYGTHKNAQIQKWMHMCGEVRIQARRQSRWRNIAKEQLSYMWNKQKK